MKVLILHQHFKSPETGGAIRSYYLAKALVEKGIEAVVITGSSEKNYRVQNLEGIEVHHLPIAYDNSFGFTSRSFSFLKYIWKSVSVARKIQNVDICYAISTPLTIGLAALQLKKKLNLKYIFEVGDLWPDAPVQLGFVKNYFFTRFLYWLEKIIYKNADSIVALSEPIKEAIEKKITGKKIHVIPNFADCNYYLPESKRSDLEEKYSVRGKFVVSYIGALGVANGLDYIIECANASRKAELPIHFIICGEGAMRESLEFAAKKLNLSNLSFTGFVDRQSVKEIMNITDASFICYKNVPILETGSPNKYFDALASGKLIITNFGGWIKTEIELMKCGISLDPGHPTDFVKKIEPFLNDKNLLEQFHRSSRELAEKKYDRNKLSTAFVDIFIKA